VQGKGSLKIRKVKVVNNFVYSWLTLFSPPLKIFLNSMTVEVEENSEKEGKR
jgi:hypothetical protein